MPRLPIALPRFAWLTLGAIAAVSLGVGLAWRVLASHADPSQPRNTVSHAVSQSPAVMGVASPSATPSNEPTSTPTMVVIAPSATPKTTSAPPTSPTPTRPAASSLTPTTPAAPTVVPTPAPTLAPTPTPTPDTRPFTATMTKSSWIVRTGEWGETVTVTANKAIAQCTIIISSSGGGVIVSGPGTITGATCMGSSSDFTSASQPKAGFVVVSTTGETITNRSELCTPGANTGGC